MKPYLQFILLLATTLTTSALLAQQIVFDRGVRAGQLTVFPEVSNPNNYFYLPDKAAVAVHEDGKPMFSFIRYVRNTQPAAGSAATITESNEAGGVLHVLVSLSVPPDMLKEAERALQRVNSNGKIIGPVIYKSGKVALISSIIGTDGAMTTKVVGIGAAPILDGQKAALSVLLTKQGSDILWATFQTPTPDLSFAFEMDARGYLSPKSVKIEADFEQIYSHKGIEVAAVTPVLAAEIKASFDELSNTGAIKVTQIGEDADLNKMKETAYNQLVNLMFDRVGGQGVPELSQLMGMNNQRSMLDRATDMLTNARREAREENERLAREHRENREYERRIRNEARTAMDSFYRSHNIPHSFPPANPDSAANRPERVPIPSFAVAASFQLKEVRRKGKYMIDLNKYTEDNRTFPFAENVGNILKKCPTCFFSINIDDPLYKQREVHAKLVGVNASDFDTYINNVEVVMRKKHENSELTLQSLIIDRKKFNSDGNDFTMIYGWKGDNNRKNWLSFDYKTKWTFNNGATVETDWKTQDFAAVNLIPPLIKRDVYVELDPEFAQNEGIRAVEIKIFNTPTAGKSETKTVNLKTADNILSKSVELVMPENKEDYEYEVVLFPKGKAPVKVPRKPSNFGSLYLDSL
ncbi:MAG: hypothetical protein IT259_18060 [Saprospiraceae bacterium]|nr:hypothetical protein [Saprospiraceae bacterium]